MNNDNFKKKTKEKIDILFGDMVAILNNLSAVIIDKKNEENRVNLNHRTR